MNLLIDVLILTTRIADGEGYLPYAVLLGPGIQPVFLQSRQRRAAVLGMRVLNFTGILAKLKVPMTGKIQIGLDLCRLGPGGQKRRWVASLGVERGTQLCLLNEYTLIGRASSKETMNFP